MKFFCYFLLASFNTTKCFPSFFLFSVISHDQRCTWWSKFHRHRLQRRGPWSYFPELFQSWKKIRLELKKRMFSWGRWISHLNVRSHKKVFQKACTKYDRLYNFLENKVDFCYKLLMSVYTFCIPKNDLAGKGASGWYPAGGFLKNSL